MRRVYTLPYGVVPELPTKLALYVALGPVEADGLVRSFVVDRCAVKDHPETDVALTCVDVTTRFLDDEALVGIRILVHWRIPTVFPRREGAWSVQRRRIAIDRNVIE